MDIMNFYSLVACPADFSCLNEGTCANGRCSCPSGYFGFKCHKRNKRKAILIYEYIFI